MRELIRKILIVGIVIGFIGASVSVVANSSNIGYMDTIIKGEMKWNNLRNDMKWWYIGDSEESVANNYEQVSLHRFPQQTIIPSHLDVPSEEWNKTYGGPYSDYGTVVRQTGDGGYIIAGTTHSYGAGSGDFWLIKTDANGNEIWNKTYGGPYDESVGSMDITDDGGYILVGYTVSYSQDEYPDGWVVKTDANGNEIWNKTFGYKYPDALYAVAETDDGGYILTGFTDVLSKRASVWIIKIGSDGSQIWEKILSEGFISVGEDIHKTSDKGYIISGVVLPPNFIGDILLLKIDEHGKRKWCRIFDAGKDEEGYQVQQTDDNGYMILGYTGWQIYSDIWLIKTNSTGDMVWNKTIGGDGDDLAFSIQRTIDEGYILFGYTSSYSVNGYDAWIIKTDEYGDELWNQTIGGEAWDDVMYGEQTSDGYIIVGDTDSYGAGKSDIWLIKLSPEDTPPLKPTINGPSKGRVGKTYTYTASTTDPDGDRIYYMFDWGDGNISDWLGPYNSGETVSASHTWSTKGEYEVKVKAKDTYGSESEWSDPLPVTMPRSILVEKILQEFSHFFSIFSLL